MLHWLATRWCPVCGRGIYILIAHTGRLPRGQPPEGCQCVRRDADGRPRHPWWARWLTRRRRHAREEEA